MFVPNMKKYRIVQLISFIHRIHHIQYSYGYKIPFLPYGWFPEYDKRTKDREFSNRSIFKKLEKGTSGNLKGCDLYHNCTLTNIY